MNVKSRLACAPVLFLALWLTGCNRTSEEPALSSESQSLSTGTFQLYEALYGAAGALLPDGRVLVAGGQTSSYPTANCEIWDPATNAWQLTGELHFAQRRHTATRLRDGRVLVAGASSEIYDPTTGTWTVSGTLATPRMDHTATLLADGRVLIVGGMSLSAGVLAAAEIFDPKTTTWSSAGSLAAGRYSHVTAVLDDGRVLVAGGVASDLMTRLSSVELFDPVSKTWDSGAPMKTARSAFTLTRLNSGRLLAAGGNAGTTGTAELYDPSAGSWTSTGNLSADRSNHSAVLTPSGDVFLMTGRSGGETTNSTDRYVESTGRFTADFALIGGREHHVTVPLPDGRVLLAAGIANNTTYLKTAEVVKPDSCTPSTCAQLGKSCGVMPNGCNGIVVCGNPDGSCPDGGYCVQNVCQCMPTTCAIQNRTCGTIPDGCGGNLSCGTCGWGTVCGPQNVCVTQSTAYYDSTLHAPRCPGWGGSCDSGGLLVGRSTLGPELGAPNTLDGCPDGSYGDFHDFESLDRLTVSQVFGGYLKPGASVRVDAVVWASTLYAHDALDLFVAPDANSPIWSWVATVPATQPGAQTLSATFTLPPGGPLEAVRGVFRSSGTASPCSSGSSDDHDDLVFQVAPIDTTPPTVSITSPSVRWVGGAAVYIAADVQDDIGVARVDFFEGKNLIQSLFEPPWSFDWDTTDPLINGSRTLSAVAYDGAGNSSSASVDLIVDNVSPTVAVSAPTDGATLKQTVLVQAAVSDDNIVARVDFYDGANTRIGTTDSYPWAIGWNTLSAAPGPHTLTARAYDGAFNVATSEAVTVVVDNCVRTTCAAQGATCGSVSDACGGTLQCGTCAAGQTCSSNACVCAPTTCAAQGAACGSIPDGCGAALSCGSCGVGQTCSSNACVCAPTTCAAQGSTCGPIADGCGGTLQCGGCGIGETCEANGCVPVPESLTVTPVGPGTGRVTSGPSGIDCGPTCTAAFPYGSAVTLSAIAAPDSVFAGWSEPGCAGADPCVLHLDGAQEVAARFEMAPVILSVAPAMGGSVSSSPPGIVCGATCSAPYAYGSSVTLTASPERGFLFSGWSGACSGADPVCVVQVPVGQPAVPSFVPEAHVRIDPPPAGGLVSTPAGEISCIGTAGTPPELGAACEAYFAPGARIELTALAESGYVFSGWSGACAGAGLTCELTAGPGEELVLSPVFVPLVPLSIVISGAGGQVAVKLGTTSMSCSQSCSLEFPLGSSLMLTAGATSPAATFGGWSGACAAGAATCALTLDSARSVTAAFVPTPWTLSVSHGGAGSVTSNPAGIDAAHSSASFLHGTTVTLTASPVPGSSFVSWGGDCAGTTRTCTLVMDRARAVTAQFDPNDLELDATVNVSTWGGVTSSPSGIKCGTAGSVCAYAFSRTATVKLTATPARGHVFTGWSGACTGTSTTCKVVMSQQRSATASFR